jgi:outer membrane protein assembly factor BamE (lipoprotein component of BamABCDE complex)
MSFRQTGRFASLAAAAIVAVSLTGCVGSTMFVTQRTQGYQLSQDQLAQIRVGQSQALVTLVLGSPQSRNEFGNESAFYYVQTKVNQTAFGLTTVRERTVLAVYFDAQNKVKDTAIYGLQDGRVFTISSRRTPSYGEDRNFIESLIASI